MNIKYVNYILVIIAGLFISLAVFLKLVLGFDIDSDWFWFLAGIGLVSQAIISFRQQKRFDKKFKVVKRESKN